MNKIFLASLLLLSMLYLHSCRQEVNPTRSSGNFSVISVKHPFASGIPETGLFNGTVWKFEEQNYLDFIQFGSDSVFFAYVDVDSGVECGSVYSSKYPCKITNEYITFYDEPNDTITWSYTIENQTLFLSIPRERCNSSNNCEYTNETITLYPTDMKSILDVKAKYSCQGSIPPIEIPSPQ